MRLARQQRRDHPETIVALIDVVFFLLIFFMLVGRMDATAPFDVTPAITASGSDMPGGGITLSIGAEGALALNGNPREKDAVLDEINASLVTDPTQLVRVNAHKDAELRSVLPLVAAIERLGARDIVLVVTPPDSQ